MKVLNHQSMIPESSDNKLEKHYDGRDINYSGTEMYQGACAVVQYVPKVLFTF